MSDAVTFTTQYNKGSDATTDFSGTALTFGGTSGANEIRFVNSGLGATTTTPSATWPLVTKPSSGTATLNQCYAFSSDASGVLTTYTGDNTVARMFRYSWDNILTMASSPQASCFDSTAHTTPVPGTQPSVVNGSADTNNKSYVKGNFYGNGVTAGGVQHTPSAGSVGSNPSATTGTTGSVTPASTPAWLTNWQDMAGWTDYIVNGAVPQATTAGFWYFVLIVFYGASISAGLFTPVTTLQYTYS